MIADIYAPVRNDTWVRYPGAVTIGPDRWFIYLNTTKREAIRKELADYTFDTEAPWVAAKIGGDSPVSVGNCNYDRKIIRVNAYPGRSAEQVVAYVAHELGHAYADSCFCHNGDALGSEPACQVFAQMTLQLTAVYDWVIAFIAGEPHVDVITLFPRHD